MLSQTTYESTENQFPSIPPPSRPSDSLSSSTPSRQTSLDPHTAATTTTTTTTTTSSSSFLAANSSPSLAESTGATLSSPSSYAPSELGAPSPNPVQNQELPAIPSSPDPSASTSTSSSSFATTSQQQLQQLQQNDTSFSIALSARDDNSTLPFIESSYQSTSNGGGGGGGGGQGIGIGIGGTRTTGHQGGYPSQQYYSQEDYPPPTTVPVEFDEGVLRALCDSDVRSNFNTVVDRFKTDS